MRKYWYLFSRESMQWKNLKVVTIICLKTYSRFWPWSDLRKMIYWSLQKDYRTKFSAIPDLNLSFLVKDCTTVFTEPLFIIFNLNFENLNIQHWKTTRVTPVFKSGDRTDTSNYRQISLLSNFSQKFSNFYYSAKFLMPKNPCFLIGNVRGSDLLWPTEEGDSGCRLYSILLLSLAFCI